MKRREIVLSTLWIFVTLNYLYCDVLTLMDAKFLQQIITGRVGEMSFTPGFLLGASILMEIPIAMVFVSRVFKFQANRWVNIISGIIMTLVQISSLFMGSSPTMYYLFFSAIEVACTVFIVWYAWTWVRLDDIQSGNQEK
jgi:hypothetical protein